MREKSLHLEKPLRTQGLGDIKISIPIKAIKTANAEHLLKIAASFKYDLSEH